MEDKNREYSVTLTVITDIEDTRDVEVKLKAALEVYTGTTPYFDYVNVEVVAEPVECDGGPDCCQMECTCGSLTGYHIRACPMREED